MMDCEFTQRGKFFVFKKFADGFAGRLVEDESERAFRRTVFSEENDRAIENAIAQSRIGQQQSAIELNG